MRSSTMCVLAISALMGAPLVAQTAGSSTSKTKGPCSPAVSGNRNTVTIECKGISQKQADQFLKLLNKIAENQLPADQVFERLDEIEIGMKVLTDDALITSQLTMQVELQVNPSAAVTSFLSRIAKDYPDISAGSFYFTSGHPAFKPKQEIELPLAVLADQTAVGLWAFKDPAPGTDRMDLHKADFWILNDCAFEPVRKNSNNNDRFEFQVSHDGRLMGQCYSSQLVVYRNNPRLHTFSDLTGCEVYLRFSPNSPSITPGDVLLGNNGRVIKLSSFRPVSGQYNVFSTAVSKADLEPPH